MAQLELGYLPHFELNVASSNLSASYLSGSFLTSPHPRTCTMSGNVLKLCLEEVCKQHYLAGQPAPLDEIQATSPYSHFFTTCCYWKAQHIWKQFYRTGLSKKLKVFFSILRYLHCLFDSKIAIVFLIIFLCSTYMFPLAFFEYGKLMGLMKDGFVKGLSSCMKLQRMNCQGRGAANRNHRKKRPGTRETMHKLIAFKSARMYT